MPVSVPTLSASHFAARNKLGREVRFPDDSQIGTQHILGTYPARISADFQDIKGARHLTWSRGLKDRFGIGDLADDVVAEQTAETELPLEGGEARPRENSQFRLGHLYGDTWKEIVRQQLTATVLDAAHQSGWSGIMGLLASHGIDPIAAGYRLPQPPPYQNPRHSGQAPPSVAKLFAKCAARVMKRFPNERSRWAITPDVVRAEQLLSQHHHNSY